MSTVSMARVGTCLFISAVVTMLPFVVCDLFFGYNNTSSCLDQSLTDLNLDITLRTWLLVMGWVDFGLLVAFFLVMIGSCIKDQLGGCLMILTIISIIFYSCFRSAWIIIGAVMFWGSLLQSGNCDDTISSYMWAMLIMSLLGVNCFCCVGFAFIPTG